MALRAAGPWPACCAAAFFCIFARMPTSDQVIEQTRNWITQVVIGCNFCPFAAREMWKNSVHFQVEPSTDPAECLNAFLQECLRLDNDPFIETSLLIFPAAFTGFNDYLKIVSQAETLLRKRGYEGTYQVATFHPLYQFAKTRAEDAANYTNRSIYPMLHLLREAGVEQALSHYPDADKIPARNIIFARKMGIAYMQKLRDGC